jgi:allantoin racemase
MRIWHQSFTVLEELPDYATLLSGHAARVARPGTEVVLHGMRPGTYPSRYPGDHIRFSYLQRRHTQQFIDAAIEAEAGGYDAFFISTIPDVGFEDIRTLVDIPVIAFGQASLLVAATLGRRVGIINFIDALRPQLRRNADLYGLGDLLGPVLPLGLGFNDILDGYAEPKPVIDTFRQVARRAIDDGAEVIVPGEVPMNAFLAHHEVHDVDGVPVLDSFAAGLKLCELRVDLARSTSLRPVRGVGLYHDRPSPDLVAAVHDFYRSGSQGDRVER